jgi:hypothetical protein
MGTKARNRGRNQVEGRVASACELPEDREVC